MKICYMGGSQAGIIGASVILAGGYEIVSAVSYYRPLNIFLKGFNIKVYRSVQNKSFIKNLRQCDVLLSVHGREKLSGIHLKAVKNGCFNVHPYLYKYKGANPVERALNEKEWKASVDVHVMTSKIDGGKVLLEEFINVGKAQTVEEIYNRLYPTYILAISKAINRLAGVEASN